MVNIIDYAAINRSSQSGEEYSTKRESRKRIIPSYPFLFYGILSFVRATMEMTRRSEDAIIWSNLPIWRVGYMRRLLVLGSAAVMLLGLFGCGYNEMQSKEEAVFAAWGDVEAAYQRRADLVPNLVEVVKGYAKHENETLVAVTEARAKVGSVQVSKEMLARPEAIQQFQQAQSQLGGALSRLLVVSEQYPALKADQGFRDLQNQLEGTENRINVARVRYNRAVQDFNTSIRIFPNSLTNSWLLHLNRKEPFKAEGGAATAPKVKF
jgi:LemA protein